MNVDGSIFSFVNEATLSFRCNQRSSLPIDIATRPKKRYGWGFLAPEPSGRLNVSKAMEELLYCHNICGHYDIGKTQRLNKIRVDDLEPMIVSKSHGVASCNIPLYRSCLYGKGRLTYMHKATSKPTVEHSNIIKEDDLLSGDCVSTDQHKCIIWVIK